MSNGVIYIEYGACHNPRGGFLPVVQVNGRRITDEWASKGFDLQNAIVQASEQAIAEHRKYVGDWHVIMEPMGRFELDARYIPTSVLVFKTYLQCEQGKAVEMALNLQKQGFRWVRVIYADVRSHYRFEPIKVYAFGTDWHPA